ncbi:MAG: InlB B-repeat-containing protein [Paludibacteraceae bacterium]|nr:InlB B-repeat-containing protein [Paludibacteraceae bacterium]
MKNLVFNLRTAKAQAEGCAKVTKSSRMAKVLTTLTLLLTLCVGQMWGYTVYLYTGSFTDWESGADFQIWDGSSNHDMTSLGNHWYSTTLTGSPSAWIKRVKSSNHGEEWNSFSASITSSKNVWYVSGWNSGGELKYYIKHPWDGGSWTWQNMTFDSANTFKYTGIYKSGNGANVNQDKGDSNYLSPSNTSNVNDKVPAIWTYTPSSNSLRIDPAYTLTVNADSHGSASGSQPKGIKMSTKYAISASNNTGYHFSSWSRVSGGTCTFDNSSSASTNVTVTGNASATVKASFAANTYTVAYNANDDQYPGTASGSTTSSSHTYGTAKNLTSNGFSRTGYIFAGWATTPNGDVAYTNGQSVTNLSSTQGATVTLYAKWTAITVSATVSPTSGTVGSNSLTFSITSNVPTNSNYYVGVYNFGESEYAAGELNGVTAYNSNPQSYTGSPNFASEGTYYTRVFVMKESVVQATSDKVSFLVASATFSVTVNAGAGGTVSPTSISASESSWSSNITATPNAGYRFVNWTSSGGGITINGNTSNPTQVKATSTGGTLTANFAAATYRVTLDNQSATTAGTEYVDATYNTTTLTTITKPTKTNYTFGGYYTATDGGGTQIIDANGNWLASKSGFTNSSRQSIITENKILYAKWTETKYAVRVAVSDPDQAAGNIYCSAAGWVASKDGTAQIGNLTNVTITVPAGATGYTYTGGSWALTGGVTLVSGSLTSPSITVKATATGSAVFTYAEDLSTTWYIAGDASGSTAGSPFAGWGTDGTRMQKKAGYSTIEKYYCTFNVTTIASAGSHFPFKVYNSSTSKYYEISDSESSYWITKDNNSGTLYNADKANMLFRPYVTGTYEFEVDNTGANPVLTVHWPVINQVQIYGATPADVTNTNNFDLSTPVSNVRSKTLSLNANTTYRFKIVYNSEFYGDSETFTRSTSTSSNSETLTAGDGGDMTLTTDYAGDYTFKFNESTKALSIDFPEAYKITWGVGTVPGNKYAITCKKYGTETAVVSNSTWISSGNKVTFYAGNNDPTKVVKDGYTWRGYYSEAAGTTQLSNQTGYSPVINAANMSFYACFYENDYTVTVNAGTGGKVNSLSSTTITGHVATLANLPTATADPGYYFVNWTTTAGTLTNSTSATTGKINGLTSTATVTANFAPIWTIAGLGGDWNTNKLPLTSTYVESTVNYAYLDIDTLRPNTTYQFKAIQRSPSGATWWRAENTTTSKDIYYSNSNTRINMSSSDGDNFYLHTAGTGTYTFDINLDNSKHPIKVHYPTSFTVTFGYGTGGSAVTATVEDATSITSGQYAAEGKDITFAQTPATGYTFKGWYNAESGGTAISCMSSDNVYDDIATNITVYAQYNPKTYTVTLTNSGTGYGSGGQANLTATYDAPFPSITLPAAAEGYAFMGYYSEANGAGTQFTNASGVLLANITDYSDESGNWKYDGTKTLYAYFKKAEITDITLNASIFEPVEADADPKAYVTADPVIAPTPTPYTKLCWELRYSNDNPVTGHDPIPVSGDQVKFLLNGLAAGGYKIHVELRTGSTCGAGTLLSSYDKSFSIASDHIVTVQYKCGDFTLKAPTSVGGKPLDWSEVIEAASITGYTFNHWEAGEGVTIKDDEGEDKTTSTDATIQIKAIYDSKLTAVYTKKRVIYFYNTLGWSNVYVYFYSGAYWDNNKGTGSETGGAFTGIKGQMLPIEEGSHIYYFDAEAAGVNASYTYVSFTELLQENYKYFAKTSTTKNKVIYRGDYKSTTLPMFVPLTGVDPVSKNEGLADYYNEGYWMNYPENTGYTLKIYSSQDATTPTRTIRFPFSADTKMPLKLDVELNEAATNYYYTIYREDGQVLSADYGMNKNYHSEVRLNDASKKISIKTTAPGIYKYSLVYMNKSGTKDYYISVDYPIVENDYRVLYSDNAQWSQSTAHGAGWSHPSDVVRKNTDAEVTQYDTVSFYIAKGDGITASMKFQYASEIVEAGTITWKDVTGGGITLSDFSDVITAAGVYNFIIKQEGTDDPVVEKVEPYTGNFYIRTDGAGSTKWDNYQASDHQMTYTEFSMSAANSFGDKYSHYFMHWSPGGTNIKFVVANDYSPCISDTLEYDLHDWGNLNAGGQLKHEDGKSETEDIYSANVRFMYNYKTNKISRAYVSSSTNASRLFLVLRGNEVIKDENGTAVNDQGVTNGAILSDKENWIYERILYIKPNSRFKLFACYAEASPTQSGAQYFRGAYDSDNFTSDANSVILISGTGSYQKARVLYDFKTNRLVCAWLPSDEPIDETLNIDADVMVIRDHQEAAECITFSGGSLTQVKTVYGAMKFNRWTLNNRYRGKGGVEDNNKDHCDSPADIAEYHGILPAGEQKSVYERSLYFISFPFDVKVSEIFGFGTYGKHWVLEYYDGLNRAKNGYWIDSPANWKYVTPSMAKTYELKAYEGYILCLSLGRMAYDNTEIWPNNISNVELYFPSKTPMANIQTTSVNISGLNEIAGDPYRCTINREGEDGDRRIKDSYWRCLGVPSYDMYAGTLTSDGSTTVINWQTDYSTFPFLYAWNMNDNTLTPQSTDHFTFKPMHAYLTQIGTAIYWKNVSATPASVMARQTEEPAEYNWRLTLNNGEDLIDQTYVRMSTDEVITNEFDFGQDLSKELNTGRSDIYSFIGNERAAANSLQMNTETTTVVRLGLNIEATGDYTFSIPDGTNGIGITLIDEETGIRTSLSALDYTVELAAGDYTERFWLEISPVKGTETGIDPGVDARENGVRKVMIDGLLYIVRDGKMYDATGKRVE